MSDKHKIWYQKWDHPEIVVNTHPQGFIRAERSGEYMCNNPAVSFWLTGSLSSPHIPENVRVHANIVVENSSLRWEKTYKNPKDSDIENAIKEAEQWLDENFPFPTNYINRPT